MKKALIILMLLEGTAQAADIERDYGWDAPTDGSPAVRYEVQVDTGGGWVDVGTTATTQTTITIPEGSTSMVRVRAEDQDGRFGLWSVASEPYTDLGAPGQAGQPTMIQGVAAAVLLLLALLGVRRGKD